MSSRQSRRHRQATGDGRHTLVWGVNPVMELLTHAPQSLIEISVLPSFGRKKRQKALLAHAGRRGIAVHVISDFNRLPLAEGAVHQGVCSWARPVWDISLDHLSMAWGDEVPMMVVCDEISDPGNLGAIIRSSAAFGAHVVMISERNSAAVNGTVIKASAGNIVHLRVCRVRNTAKAIESLRQSGIWTAALAVQESTAVWDADLKVPLAFVLGAEGRGLRQLVIKRCDMRLHVPQAEGVESLNVAAACTAALYETARQRRTIS